MNLLEPIAGLRLLPLITDTLPPATHTNTYIIGEESFIVVDPGPSDPTEYAKLAREITYLIAQGRQFKSIVLTHHHRDHIGAVVALQKQFHVEIIAHRETAKLVAPSISIDQLVQDGDIIAPDTTGKHDLLCLHTPGHAPGHLCFLHTNSDSIIAGDLVATQGTIIVNPPEGNMADYMASLYRIRDMSPGLLLPSHGSMVEDPHQLLSHYIEHRLARESRVIAALEKIGRPASARQLLPEVYGEIPREIWPLAERSLLAHLLYLEQQQRVMAYKLSDGTQWSILTD